MIYEKSKYLPFSADAQRLAANLAQAHSFWLDARQALLAMLMVVNPGVQVYVLDADGRVEAYIGQPGMVRRDQVDLGPVRSFLRGAPLPLRGSDPMGSTAPRLFSAAMFPPRSGDARPPGYLYIVLDGAQQGAGAPNSERRLWVPATFVATAGLLATLGVGLVAFSRMTLPLNRLSRRMGAYSGARVDDLTRPGDGAPKHDEVRAIEAAFDDMTLRLEEQAAREKTRAAEHLETMAGVAHDLRTPLTALHGHLEALAEPGTTEPARGGRLLAAALTQSDKVRRLSQQLFELAVLQSSDQALVRERFNLDELVTDVVQKFELSGPVALAGSPPGRLEVTGDFQMVERALTNLIDNALRHAPGPAPVLVSLRRTGDVAEILIEDRGVGLPIELAQRLEFGRSVRDPPLRRAGGGIGGLGLAIAQRVATLHGGGLKSLPAPDGGARMCLALALASEPAA